MHKIRIYGIPRSKTRCILRMLDESEINDYTGLRKLMEIERKVRRVVIKVFHSSVFMSVIHIFLNLYFLQLLLPRLSRAQVREAVWKGVKWKGKQGRQNNNEKVARASGQMVSVSSSAISHRSAWGVPTATLRWCMGLWRPPASAPHKYPV